MDGWVNVLDLASGAVSHRLPVGWRGAAGLAVDALDWQNFDVVTTVQVRARPGCCRLSACFLPCP